MHGIEITENNFIHFIFQDYIPILYSSLAERTAKEVTMTSGVTNANLS